MRLRQKKVGYIFTIIGSYVGIYWIARGTLVTELEIHVSHEFKIMTVCERMCVCEREG